MKTHNLTLPLSPAEIDKLKINDKVLLTGYLFTARDVAHKRMMEIIQKGEVLPFELSEIALFYCGPSPVRPGNICGAIGPTTSSRMNSYTPYFIQKGLRVMIGKGEISSEVQNTIKEYKAVYLTMAGGISAYLSQFIVSCETFLWPELGPEAIHKLLVKEIPAYVQCK
ncbi:MAG TPA: FumA C-terminus/TtdB family hydratase beta subunit [Candidatus Cloacimonas sp.]|jgi:fumarate hydratase subunit beta|nr:fumarate hydratase C-terminal domain-containing protein [Candidatus Cloacimonas sp.]HNZ33366.1 FumA C-terminus/TtdB family hydratase beta subunit [Candidatus Cloacimonas sp.]HPH71959.1 FumA C-terminus/TtdB family hydratase beta subunit [Candidatus Cloacimonas sp.]HQM17425.1 FumA C-terminus/TtdB family hydratase beta subunit [Candidatus Cloacimonas sp.]HRR51592.1 FumA C-terminus/TtdB family hydratase beta subunit [Candidatus Cloacimonas sp.]